MSAADEDGREGGRAEGRRGAGGWARTSTSAGDTALSSLYVPFPSPRPLFLFPFLFLFLDARQSPVSPSILIALRPPSLPPLPPFLPLPLPSPLPSLSPSPSPSPSPSASTYVDVRVGAQQRRERARHPPSKPRHSRSACATGGQATMAADGEKRRWLPLEANPEVRPSSSSSPPPPPSCPSSSASCFLCAFATARSRRRRCVLHRHLMPISVFVAVSSSSPFLLTLSPASLSLSVSFSFVVCFVCPSSRARLSLTAMIVRTARLQVMNKVRFGARAGECAGRRGSGS